MPLTVDQLPLDGGDMIAEVLRKFFPQLLERSYIDAGAVLGVELAFDLANPLVQQTLSELSTLVRTVADTTRDEIRALIGKGADEGWSVARLADEIAALGEIQAKGRAKVIARTETAAAYSKGSLLAFADSGVVGGVEWLLGPQSCPICQELAGKVVPLGDAFADGIDHPPAHPNCTCAISPVLKEL